MLRHTSGAAGGAAGKSCTRLSNSLIMWCLCCLTSSDLDPFLRNKRLDILQPSVEDGAIKLAAKVDNGGQLVKFSCNVGGDGVLLCVRKRLRGVVQHGEG